MIRGVTLSLFALAFGVCAKAQIQRDAQAVTILTQSLAAMGVLPTDSSATGTITVVEGSTTQSGTIQILTKGTAETSQAITLPSGLRQVIYSYAAAEEISAGQSTIAMMELTVTDQCPDFPLPLLSAIATNPDEALQYIGQETINGQSVQHITVWNTYTSYPALQSVTPFTVTDIYFDSSSALPVKISYHRQAGGGAVPSFLVEVFFSNYTNVNGTLYAFQITKSFNGTPWETITIQSVSFNVGLTDAQFQIQ